MMTLSDGLLSLGVVAGLIDHRRGKAVAGTEPCIAAAGVDEGARGDEAFGDQRDLGIFVRERRTR